MPYPFEDKLRSMELTGAQVVTLHQRWDNWRYVYMNNPRTERCPDTFEEFLLGLIYGPGGDYVGFKWGGMFVGVERDGYAHT